MIEKVMVAMLAFSMLTFPTSAQIPATGSLAGVTVISPGTSIKPQDLMPTEPFRPGPRPPRKRNNARPAPPVVAH